MQDIPGVERMDPRRQPLQAQSGTESLDFAGRLARLRKEHFLSQRELARRIGVSPQHVSDLERGKSHNIDIRQLLALCAVLDVDPNTLLGFQVSREQVPRVVKELLEVYGDRGKDSDLYKAIVHLLRELRRQA